ncbi:MAG: ABC-2 family transporter protein [Thermomicrobiales bacterium]|nr:ABC-2 family transporter protein [Thermomicrobiales bacterium]
MTALRLLWLHLRIGVMNELQYRANFVLQLGESAIGLLTALLGLGIVFAKTDDLGGWSPDELLVVVGIYFLVGGLAQMVVQPSLQRFMEDVRQGTLDFTLTKPVDAQTLVSIRQVEVWKLVDIAIGIGVLVVALVRLGHAIGPAEAAAFLVALLAGAAIVYAFLMILATCVFWFIRLDNILVIFQSMYEAGRWPITIYPSWLRLGLTFLVPIGFAVTVPAQGLVGRLTLELLAGAVALAVAMPLAARWFWHLGLRRYGGASA